VTDRGRHNGGPELVMDAAGEHAEGQPGFARGPGAQGKPVVYFKRHYFIAPPGAGETYAIEVVDQPRESAGNEEYDEQRAMNKLQGEESGNVDAARAQAGAAVLETATRAKDGPAEVAARRTRFVTKTATGDEDVQDFWGSRLGYQMYLKTKTDAKEYLHLRGTLRAVV